MDARLQFIKNVLADARTDLKESGGAFAPSNIALCKYWGKRDAILNLPINSSLSVSLDRLGTRTEIRLRDGAGEPPAIHLNGNRVDPSDAFAVRTFAFLDLFHNVMGDAGFEIHTENNVPTAAGLASSASGFAALVMALNDLAGWGLDAKRLSMLARLGSGSAARSLYHGFVQWNAGSNPDGSDSFAEKLPYEWPEFRIGILELSRAQKAVGSRDGMNRTVETSELYKSWPKQAATDLETIRAAIGTHDFPLLGKTAEHNALSMHATMLAAWPPLLYLLPETTEQIHKVQRVHAEGLEVYLTIDAGPNIKLLFLEENEVAVADTFHGLKVIKPFG